MVDYKALYFKLFAAMADAVNILEESKDIEKAKKILINAHIEAEEIYIESDGDCFEYVSKCILTKICSNDIMKTKRGIGMVKKNDVVNGLRGKVVEKSNGKKKAVIRIKPMNQLGYDGCGTHTHK